MGHFAVRSLPGLPEVSTGADLAQAIVALTTAQARPLSDGQIVAIAHKAVSKAEGATVDLREVTPGPRAIELTLALNGGPRPTNAPEKDPRTVQVVMDQAEEIVRAERGVLVCRTRHGLVCANAGVDASNSGDPHKVVTLPRDPDGSARHIRTRVRELTGARVGVLISDSFGRPWRQGQCDVAIGCAGIAQLDDWRGRADSDGRPLYATWLAVADAIAAAAELARTKDSREPVVIVEGLERFVTEDDGPGAAALVRPAAEDLFR